MTGPHQGSPYDQNGTRQFEAPLYPPEPAAPDYSAYAPAENVGQPYAPGNPAGTGYAPGYPSAQSYSVAPDPFGSQDSYGGAPDPFGAPVVHQRPRRVVVPAQRSGGTGFAAGIVGLLLSFGALAIWIPLVDSLEPSPTTSVIATSCLLIAMMSPLLLAAWSPMAPLIPGLAIFAISLLSNLSTPGRETLRDLFGESDWGSSMLRMLQSTNGLATGIALTLGGLAAIMVKRSTRRAVQDALDAEHASSELQGVLRG